jgi:hypothetical protein
MTVVGLAQFRQQSLLDKLRSKQAELIEVYRRKAEVQEISDQLIEEIKATLSADEWRSYSHGLDECWSAARYSEDDLSYANSVLYEAIKQLEKRK